MKLLLDYGTSIGAIGLSGVTNVIGLSRSLNVTVKPPETNMKNLHETILYGCYMDQVMWDNIWDTKQVSRKCNFPRDISQKLQYENIASSSAATDFFKKKQVTL